MTSIRDALQELLVDSAADFVLIEVEGTDRFVQIARVGGRLVLDLPLSALSGDEFDRAEAYFFRTGGAMKPWADEVEGGDRSYRADFGRDFDRAARIAEGIFRDVYRVSPDDLLMVRLEKTNE